MPSRIGQRASSWVGLLADDARSALEHELVTYHDEAAAAAALELLRAASRCRHFSRPDANPGGATQVDVSSLSVPRHVDTVALRMLVAWADGTEQGFVLTGTQYGDVVSYLGVDAPQGGIPAPEYVATFIDAVVGSPA